MELDILSYLMGKGSGGGGGVPIFPQTNVVQKVYNGNFTTFNITQKGYYAAVGFADGSKTVAITHSTTATVVDEDSKTVQSGNYGSAVVGLIVSADAGDTITISSGSYNRGGMIIVFIPDTVKRFGDIELVVAKDSEAVATISQMTKNYCFYFAGSTGSDNVTATKTSPGTEQWAGEVTAPITRHIYGAYDNAVTATASGSSYATNYAMVFEVGV